MRGVYFFGKLRPCLSSKYFVPIGLCKPCCSGTVEPLYRTTIDSMPVETSDWITTRVTNCNSLERTFSDDSHYCNALLYGVPTGTVKKLQRVQNNAGRVVLQAPRRSDAKRLLRSLHWLPVKQTIVCKTAVVTFKVQYTATPAYLSRYLQTRNSVRNLRSSDTYLLSPPFAESDFAILRFRHPAPAVWNSLSDTFFSKANQLPCSNQDLITNSDCMPRPLKLRPYDGIERDVLSGRPLRVAVDLI